MKTSMLGLIVAAGACAASSLYLWQELSAERDRAAQVERTTRELKARIAELEQARALFARQRTTSPASLGSAHFGQGTGTAPPRPAEVAAATPEPQASPEVWTQASRPERSETFKKVMRAQIRASNKKMYADVGTELGLDKDTTNKLIDLLTAQQLDMFDVAPHDLDRPAAREKFDERLRNNETAVADLIGTDKLAGLKQYQESMPARGEFEMMARQLEANDAALTPEQAKKLLAVYVQERQRVPMPEFSAENGPTEDYVKAAARWEEEYIERVSDGANSILTSAQLAAYNEIQQWQKEMRTQFSAVTVNSGGRRGMARAVAMPMGATGNALYVAPVPPPKAEEVRKP